jgi:hypothetical protein
VTVHRVRFEGPASLAVGVATGLADSDGVDLVSSEPPSLLDDGRVGLVVAVEGAPDAVAAAVASLRGRLPERASIEVAAD